MIDATDENPDPIITYWWGIHNFAVNSVIGHQHYGRNYTIDYHRVSYLYSDFSHGQVIAGQQGAVGALGSKLSSDFTCI